MFRKALIVVLTLAAVGTLALWGIRGEISQRYWYNIWSFELKTAERPAHRVTISLVPNAIAVLEQWKSDRWLDFYFVEFLGVRYYRESAFWHRADSGRPPPNCYVNGRWLWVPYWLVSASFTICPTVAVIRGPVWRWRRRRRNQCVHCGYNLTGNVSGVCPECATKVKD